MSILQMTNEQFMQQYSVECERIAQRVQEIENGQRGKSKFPTVDRVQTFLRPAIAHEIIVKWFMINKPQWMHLSRMDRLTQLYADNRGMQVSKDLEVDLYRYVQFFNNELDIQFQDVRDWILCYKDRNASNYPF